MSSQFGLLTTRRFAPFFITQFLGAFNDNLFKNALVVLLAFQAASWTSLKVEVLTNLAAGIFILPFFLFSATAGQLADKYDKAQLTRLVKLLEIGIMVVAGAGFWLHSLAVLLTALFLLGCHSTLFGPVKYAILPQHLHADELVGGNALVESGTFAAILIGTLAGGLLAGSIDQPLWIAVGGALVAMAGYGFSRNIPSAPAPAPDLHVNTNPFTETVRNIAFARNDRTVFLSILGISWFWLYGALFLAQFPLYAKKVMGGTETTVTLLLAIFTVGIGVGSLLCERLSGKRVEIGLVPLGAIGLSVFGLDLAFAAPATIPVGAPLHLMAMLSHPWAWHILVDLILIGMFGGFFIVPLYTLVQVRSAPEHRARIIAANNILNALFMVIGAVAAAALLGAGMTIPVLFGIGALCTALVAVSMCRLVPEFVLRFLAWLMVHSVYRLEKQGMENIPVEGAAVLISNHVSSIDAVLILAAAPRPVRFLIDQRLFRIPVLGYMLRHSGAIELPSDENGPAYALALAEAERTLASGNLVGVFPEGGVNGDDLIRPFTAVLSQLIEASPVMVVPMALQGLRGSFFSRIDGRPFRSSFRRGLFSRIRLSAGIPVAPDAATPQRLQDEVARLHRDGWHQQQD